MALTNTIKNVLFTLSLPITDEDNALQFAQVKQDPETDIPGIPRFTEPDQLQDKVLPLTLCNGHSAMMTITLIDKLGH